MKHATTALALGSAILLGAIPKASAAQTHVYKDITVLKISVHNHPGGSGDIEITANMDLCPGTKTTAVIYNDTTHSADFKNMSAWLMSAYLSMKRMDIQVASVDANPSLCRVEQIWIY